MLLYSPGIVIAVPWPASRCPENGHKPNRISGLAAMPHRPEQFQGQNLSSPKRKKISRLFSTVYSRKFFAAPLFAVGRATMVLRQSPCIAGQGRKDGTTNTGKSN